MDPLYTPVEGVSYFMPEYYRSMARAPNAYALLLFDAHADRCVGRRRTPRSRVALVERRGRWRVLRPLTPRYYRSSPIPPETPVLRVPTTLKHFKHCHYDGDDDGHELRTLCESGRFVPCTSPECCASRVDDTADAFTVETFRQAAADIGYVVVPCDATAVVLMDSRPRSRDPPHAMWIWTDESNHRWFTYRGPLPHHEDRDRRVIVAQFTPITLGVADVHRMFEHVEERQEKFAQDVFRIAYETHAAAVHRWADILATAQRVAESKDESKQESKQESKAILNTGYEPESLLPARAYPAVGGNSTSAQAHTVSAALSSCLSYVSSSVTAAVDSRDGLVGSARHLKCD